MRILAIGERFNQKEWKPSPEMDLSFDLRVKMGLYNRGPRRRFLDELGVKWTHGINLLWPSPVPGEWDAAEARRVVAAIAHRVLSEYDAAILFGRRVCDAWGLPFRVGEAFRSPASVNGETVNGSVIWVPLPHPSGRSRMWNDPAVREKVRIIAAEITGG